MARAALPGPAPRHGPGTRTRMWDRPPPHLREEGLRCSQPPWAERALRGWPAGPPGTFLFLLFGCCYVALLDMLVFFFFSELFVC